MKKSIKDPWCPLTGDIGPHDYLILRARALWGVKEIVENNIGHAYRPSKAVIEKARKIYDRWDEYQQDPMRIEILELNLSMALNPGRREHARQESLKDITLLFYGLDATIQEVFSILAIYEARVSKNPAWPLELLAIAKEYSPEAKTGKEFSIGQTVKAKKPRTSCKGLTPADQKVRNQKIITRFQNSKLTMNSFIQKYKAEYSLKDRRIRDILKKAVGSQPG